VATSILIIVVVLQLWALYRIDLLQHRVDRLHSKVHAIRKAVVPSDTQSGGEVASRHPVTDTTRGLKQN